MHCNIPVVGLRIVLGIEMRSSFSFYHPNLLAGRKGG